MPGMGALRETFYGGGGAAEYDFLSQMYEAGLSAADLKGAIGAGTPVVIDMARMGFDATGYGGSAYPSGGAAHSLNFDKASSESAAFLIYAPSFWETFTISMACQNLTDADGGNVRLTSSLNVVAATASATRAIPASGTNGGLTEVELISGELGVSTQQYGEGMQGALLIVTREGGDGADTLDADLAAVFLTIRNATV